MDTPDPENVEAHEAFEKLIWGSGEICNNCFHKVVDIDLPEEYLPPVVYENYGDIQGEVREWTSDGTVDIVSSDVDEYGANTIDHPGTVCLECGSIHLQVHSYDHDTLSKEQAASRVPHLAERLREYGYSIAEQSMHELVWKGKSREKLRGDDRKLFKKAVEIGIKNGTHKSSSEQASD